MCLEKVLPMWVYSIQRKAISPSRQAVFGAQGEQRVTTPAKGPGGKYLH